MAYSREQILDMRKAGKITPAQARVMLGDAPARTPKPQPKPENPYKVLSTEMKAIAEAIKDASSKSEPAKEPDRPKEWLLTFTRDNQGLIKSPIKLEAK